MTHHTVVNNNNTAVCLSTYIYIKQTVVTVNFQEYKTLFESAALIYIFCFMQCLVHGFREDICIFEEHGKAKFQQEITYILKKSNCIERFWQKLNV